MRTPQIVPAAGFRLVRAPTLTARQLHAFYVRTGVCEAGFPVEYAGRVLDRSDVVVAVFRGATLVGIARGLCDGTAGFVAELCVDPVWQGRPNRRANASVIERDRYGVGRWLGFAVLSELRRQGASFFSSYAIDGVEERFYRSLGFEENRGHTLYHIDLRPYVPTVQRGGRFPRSVRGVVRSHLAPTRPVPRRTRGGGSTGGNREVSK